MCDNRQAMSMRPEFEEDRYGFAPVDHELARLRARIKWMREALEIIAGRRQCADNLMSNVEVALVALDKEAI